MSNPVLTEIQNTLLNSPHEPNKTVKLCVASKYASSEQIRRLHTQGLRLFGENQLQVALKKQEELSDLSDIEWHFIGHLQRNKVRKVVQNFDVIQSVDSLKLLNRINDVSAELSTITKVYIQVNAGNESNKYGFTFDELSPIENEIFSFSNIQIQGIMVVVPKTDDDSVIGSLFEEAFSLYKQWQDKHFISELSMGMSQDYKYAVQCGSTMVRIGRRLFET